MILERSFRNNFTSWGAVTSGVPGNLGRPTTRRWKGIFKNDILPLVIKSRKQYVMSGKGRKVGILLPVSEYRKILADLEELEAIRAYDAAKASRSKAIPFRQAMEELRRRK
jgi:PHD/YefM family antitoxin component YafN of YafNO toxin-antitoxin module